MTPTEIRNLLIHLLAGATGKPEDHWRTVVGEVEALPLTFNVTSNWRVDLQGSVEDITAVQSAIALVRAEHPYVSEA